MGSVIREKATDEMKKNGNETKELEEARKYWERRAAEKTIDKAAPKESIEIDKQNTDSGKYENRIEITLIKNGTGNANHVRSKGIKIEEGKESNYCPDTISELIKEKNNEIEKFENELERLLNDKKLQGHFGDEQYDKARKFSDCDKKIDALLKENGHYQDFKLPKQEFEGKDSKDGISKGTCPEVTNMRIESSDFHLAPHVQEVNDKITSNVIESQPNCSNSTNDSLQEGLVNQMIDKSAADQRLNEIKSDENQKPFSELTSVIQREKESSSDEEEESEEELPEQKMEDRKYLDHLLKPTFRLHRDSILIVRKEEDKRRSLLETLERSPKIEAPHAPVRERAASQRRVLKSINEVHSSLNDLSLESPAPPLRKKRSPSVPAFNSYQELNSANFDNLDGPIIRPPRRKRRLGKPVHRNSTNSEFEFVNTSSNCSYSLSDIHGMAMEDVDFMNFKKKTKSQSEAALPQTVLQSAFRKSRTSCADVTFSTPEITDIVTEVGVISLKNLQHRASICILEASLPSLQHHRHQEPFVPQKTPSMARKRSHTFTSGDKYMHDVRDNVKLKKTNSKSVSSLLRKTFSLKSIKKADNPPCLPNFFKRYKHKRKKSEKAKFNDLTTIREENDSSSKYETTHSFASIFMQEDYEEENGQSYLERCTSNFEPYLSSSVLFPDVADLKRSVSNLELSTKPQNSPKILPPKAHQLKRSASCLQNRPHLRLLNEESYSSLNPDAIKRAHELLNKSLSNTYSTSGDIPVPPERTRKLSLENASIQSRTSHKGSSENVSNISGETSSDNFEMPVKSSESFSGIFSSIESCTSNEKPEISSVFEEAKDSGSSLEEITKEDNRDLKCPKEVPEELNILAESHKHLLECRKDSIKHHATVLNEIVQKIHGIQEYNRKHHEELMNNFVRRFSQNFETVGFKYEAGSGTSEGGTPCVDGELEASKAINDFLKTLDSPSLLESLNQSIDASYLQQETEPDSTLNYSDEHLERLQFKTDVTDKTPSKNQSCKIYEFPYENPKNFKVDGDRLVRDCQDGTLNAKLQKLTDSYTKDSLEIIRRLSGDYERSTSPYMSPQNILKNSLPKDVENVLNADDDVFEKEASTELSICAATSTNKNSNIDTIPVFCSNDAMVNANVPLTLAQESPKDNILMDEPISLSESNSSSKCRAKIDNLSGIDESNVELKTDLKGGFGEPHSPTNHSDNLISLKDDSKRQIINKNSLLFQTLYSSSMSQLQKANVYHFPYVPGSTNEANFAPQFLFTCDQILALSNSASGSPTSHSPLQSPIIAIRHSSDEFGSKVIEVESPVTNRKYTVTSVKEDEFPYTPPTTPSSPLYKEQPPMFTKYANDEVGLKPEDCYPNEFTAEDSVESIDCVDNRMETLQDLIKTEDTLASLDDSMLKETLRNKVENHFEISPPIKKKLHLEICSSSPCHMANAESKAVSPICEEKESESKTKTFFENNLEKETRLEFDSKTESDEARAHEMNANGSSELTKSDSVQIITAINSAIAKYEIGNEPGVEKEKINIEDFTMKNSSEIKEKIHNENAREFVSKIYEENEGDNPNEPKMESKIEKENKCHLKTKDEIYTLSSDGGEIQTHSNNVDELQSVQTSTIQSSFKRDEISPQNELQVHIEHQEGVHEIKNPLEVLNNLSGNSLRKVEVNKSFSENNSVKSKEVSGINCDNKSEILNAFESDHNIKADEVYSVITSKTAEEATLGYQFQTSSKGESAGKELLDVSGSSVPHDESSSGPGNNSNDDVKVEVGSNHLGSSDIFLINPPENVIQYRAEIKDFILNSINDDSITTKEIGNDRCQPEISPKSPNEIETEETKCESLMNLDSFNSIKECCSIRCNCDAQHDDIKILAVREKLLPSDSPDIVLRTWEERQDRVKKYLNHSPVCIPKWTQNGLCLNPELYLPKDTSLGHPASDPSKEEFDLLQRKNSATLTRDEKKEDDPIPQQDRCVEVYPETLRQRQRNMAPSPSKVDIKNWENNTGGSDDDSKGGKKFLPSVKALRSQFESGKSSNGDHSPSPPPSVSPTIRESVNHLGRTSSNSSTNSLVMSSLEASSGFSSLTSSQITSDANLHKSLDEEPVEPIFCQFQSVDKEFKAVGNSPPSTIGWNPEPLLKKLYYIPEAPKMHKQGTNFVNIDGYLEKLPSGRKKATFWNAWKRRYFVVKDGTLYYYQNNQSEKANMKLPLMGGKVEIMDQNMVSVDDGDKNPRSASMLGIDDGKGHYVVVRCSTRQEAERWKKALDTHTVEDFSSQYIQPWPRPTNPTLLRDTLIIDIGSCSVRAGVLASQPTLPQLFFPSVVATNRESRSQIWGAEALLPNQRMGASVSFPIRPSHKVSKFSVDLNSISSLLQKTFKDLKVDPKNYNIQLSVPRVLNPLTQAELLKILFDKFGVKAVNLTHQSILALYAYNATSGIVVDIGERIDVVPVTDGYIVDGGVSRIPYGGFRILDHIRQFLFQRDLSLVNEVDSYIIRQALESVCYSAQHYNTEKQRCTLSPDSFEKVVPLTEYFPDTPQYEAFRNIALDFGRFQATEGLFNPDAWGLDHPGLHKLVHKAIQECSMDIRKEMSRSIFLSGGLSQLPGISERLTVELDNLTPPAIRPKVHCSPYRYHAAYLGACVLAESSAFAQSKITKDEWQKQGNAALRKWAL